MLPQCMLSPSLLSPHCPTCQSDCIASYTSSAHLAILFPPRCACSSPQLPRGATGPGRRHGPIKPTLSQRKQLKTSITTHQKRGEAMPKPLKTTPEPLKTKTPLRAEMNSLLSQVLNIGIIAMPCTLPELSTSTPSRRRVREGHGTAHQPQTRRSYAKNG